MSGTLRASSPFAIMQHSTCSSKVRAVAPQNCSNEKTLQAMRLWYSVTCPEALMWLSAIVVYQLRSGVYHTSALRHCKTANMCSSWAYSLGVLCAV